MERLVRHHGPDVLTYLCRRAGEDDAADVMGQTLLTAWRRVRDLPADDTRARMWLFVTARNTLANHHRAHRRRLRATEKLRDHLRTHTPRDPSGDADVDNTRQAVDGLPAPLRELVVLVHWDGFSLTEAAELTGASASTTRSRYARARRLLHDQLATEEPPGLPGPSVTRRGLTAVSD